MASAARDDKWLPLARVRLKQCEKERDAYVDRPRRAGRTLPAPAAR